jgi:hypothetical protein
MTPISEKSSGWEVSMKKTLNEHDEDRADKRGVIEGTPVEEHETTSPGKPGVYRRHAR